MDSSERVQMPHRPVPYHPSVAPKNKGMHAAELPATNIRHAYGAALGWRVAFWIFVALVSLSTLAFAGYLAVQ